MSPEVLSIIGILLGLAILIVFALKGVSLYVLAPLAALVVAIFAGGDILTAMTETYMAGFANFMKSYFLMFALSSIFAKIMSDSGAAKVIALKVAALVRRAPAKYQRLLAVLSVGIMTAILTVGGINLYCCIFVLVSIGKDLFEEFGIPWHLYMTSSLGSGSFTMSMIPGTPAIQNLIPMDVLGTKATAAPMLGIISTVLCIVLSVIYVKYALTKPEKREEHLLPTGAKVAVVSNKADEAVGELCSFYFPGLLDTAVGETADRRPKPAPDTVELALERLRVDKSDAVYVGDSQVDVDTARAAGLPCIAVTWGFRSREDLVAAGAETLADTPEQLLQILQEA